MIHYHGGPITPTEHLYRLAGCHFCCSHAKPQQVALMQQLGQSLMLDNGAFSKWKKNKATDWPAFYDWCDPLLANPTTWAVIPDVIDGGSQLQDSLLKEWPFGHKGSPVWHMDEPMERLLALCDAWPRVCVGSTAEYAVVLSPQWQARMDEAFNELAKRHRHLPWLHMLRGMQCSGKRWPFGSADSTDVARNHSANGNSVVRMVQRWDVTQPAPGWRKRKVQIQIEGLL